jgi:hypothetical protein
MSSIDESTVDGDRAGKKRSKAWIDFTKVKDLVNGKRVRVSTTCIHFKASFYSKSYSGTSHFLRHVDTCAAKKKRKFNLFLIIIMMVHSCIRSTLMLGHVLNCVV